MESQGGADGGTMLPFDGVTVDVLGSRTEDQVF
jgi:hypothetical protein